MRYPGKLAGIVLAVGFLGACVSQQQVAQSAAQKVVSFPWMKPVEKKDYTQFREENLRSILIVPVVNSSVNVNASNYILSTIATPVAERGYYTFPINLVKQVMEEDGLSDANMVHAADPTRLGELFGADAILYITIEHWETTYFIIGMTTVSFTYVLKSGRSGEELWRESSKRLFNPSPYSFQLTVESSFIARSVNARAIWTPSRGLPAGPYHKLYGKDLDKF